VAASETPPERLTEDELAALREALAGRPSWFDLSQVLDQVAKAMSSFGLRLVGMAFAYDLVPASGDRRDRAGGAYATMFESAEGTYPPRPGEVAEEARSLALCSRRRR
jgi:hypothetical protein